jgi:hypothetical protein
MMDLEHFEQVIKKYDEKIAETELWLRERDSGDDNRGYYDSFSYLTYEKLNALYSAGNPLSDLKPLFTDVLAFGSRSIEYYTGPGIPVEALALGTLLGFSPEDRTFMQEMIDLVIRKDPFPAFLAQFNGFSYVLDKPDKRGGNSWWRWFPKLRDMETKAEREEYLAMYMKRNWYGSMQGKHWWNYHKDHPKLYFGYWAFDIAAAVAAFGLDDSAFSDHKYYPKELAHYLKR